LSLALFLILLPFILLLLPMRLQLLAQYDQNCPGAHVWLGPLRVFRYPGPKKEPVKEKEKKEKPKKEKSNSAEILQEAFKERKLLEQLKAGANMAKAIFAQIRRRLIIRELTLHYTVATQDAAQTALTYGRLHAVMGNLLGLLRSIFRVKQEDVRLMADFEREKSQIFFRIRISITVWSVLYLGLFTLRQVRKSGLLPIGALVRSRFKRNAPIQKGETHGQASPQ